MWARCGFCFCVDGVLCARPASTTLDFIDVERIELLRGQCTLFGMNTTAGAILVTTRRPSFSAEADLESSVGSEGFVQAKASLRCSRHAGIQLQPVGNYFAGQRSEITSRLETRTPDRRSGSSTGPTRYTAAAPHPGRLPCADWSPYDS